MENASTTKLVAVKQQEINCNGFNEVLEHKRRSFQNLIMLIFFTMS